MFASWFVCVGYRMILRKLMDRFKFLCRFVLIVDVDAANVYSFELCIYTGQLTGVTYMRSKKIGNW